MLAQDLGSLSLDCQRESHVCAASLTLLPGRNSLDVAAQRIPKLIRENEHNCRDTRVKA